MADILFGKLDLHREAYKFCLMASGLHNSPDLDWTDPETLYGYFRQRFHLDEAALQLCSEAYRACQATIQDKKALQELFTPLVSDDLCAASLIECAISTGNKPKQLLRMLSFVMDMPEGSEKNEDAFLQALAKENYPDSLCWLCVSILHDLPRLVNRINALFSPIMDALQSFVPRFELLTKQWEERMLVETDNKKHLPAFFEIAGLKMDEQPLLLIPTIFCFADITISSEQLLLPISCRIPVYCGIFTDIVAHTFRVEKNDEKQLLDTLHALDDKNRLQILKALEDNPLNGRQLSALTGLSPATVSHHMSELVSASLATIEKKGVSIEYRQNKEQVQLLINQLNTQLLGK